MIVNEKLSRRYFIVLCMALTMLISSIPVFAVTEEVAMNSLTSYVATKMLSNEYSMENGGTLKGSDLFEGSTSDGYDLNEDEFQKLSSKAQSEVVSDIAKYSNEAVESDDIEGVEESTVQTWWKQLQTKQGVGSKFMNEILKNTKPDFVTANRIYKPFSGPISTFIGIFVVFTMGLLGLVMAADIAYIVIPPFRLLVSENNEKGRLPKSKIFSSAAIKAVEVAEQGDGQALGYYFKKRFWELIILGICLMYLVQGQLYTFVGYILDLVSGFLGF